MKHLKFYEAYNNDNDALFGLKKILTHITKILEDMGFSSRAYYDSGKFQTEFYLDDDYLFFIEMRIRWWDTEFEIILTIGKSLFNFRKAEITDFILDYLEKIKGVDSKVVSSEYNYMSRHDELNKEITFEGDADDIIKQITLEDFSREYELYKNVNIYDNKI